MKKMTSKLVKSLLGFAYRINPVFRYSLRQGLTVFVFHEVSDNPSEFARKYGLNLTIQNFRNQAEWINNNFNLVSPEALTANSTLPKNAALVTFDDGFELAFKNAFPILEELNIPVLMFMNMLPQIENTPMLSAKVLYLSEHNPDFISYLEDLKLSVNPHLVVTPSIMKNFDEKYGMEYDDALINSYQGDLADKATMEYWDSSPNVYYGNHFYDHWNAASLSKDELSQQYLLNKKALEKYVSAINFVAFTNGKPDTCFSSRDINILKSLGVSKIFSSVNGVNSNPKKTLLGRVYTHDSDESPNQLWCRLGLSYSNLI